MNNYRFILKLSKLLSREISFFFNSILSEKLKNLSNLINLRLTREKIHSSPILVKYSKVKFNEILTNERIIKSEDRFLRANSKKKVLRRKNCYTLQGIFIRFIIIFKLEGEGILTFGIQRSILCVNTPYGRRAFFERCLI